MTDPADGLAVYRNVDHVEALGLEVGLEGRTDFGLRARASYAVQRAEDLETHAEFSREFPEHLAKLNVSLPVYRDWLHAGLELQYASTAASLNGDEIDDYLIANFTLLAQEIVRGSVRSDVRRDVEAPSDRWTPFCRPSVPESGGSGGLPHPVPQPVLTVADLPGFATRGGMFNCFVENGRLRFECNREAVQRSGIKVSGRLRQIARIVRDEKPAADH